MTRNFTLDDGYRIEGPDDDGDLEIEVEGYSIYFSRRDVERMMGMFDKEQK